MGNVRKNLVLRHTWERDTTPLDEFLPYLETGLILWQAAVQVQLEGLYQALLLACSTTPHKSHHPWSQGGRRTREHLAPGRQREKEREREAEEMAGYHSCQRNCQ